MNMAWTLIIISYAHMASVITYGPSFSSHEARDQEVEWIKPKTEGPVHFSCRQINAVVGAREDTQQ